MAKKDREPKEPKDGDGNESEQKTSKPKRKAIHFLVFPRRSDEKDSKDREKRK